ncbi:MAG: hypothetical protein ACI31D_06010 [Candidatus Limisoma sp.]
MEQVRQSGMNAFINGAGCTALAVLLGVALSVYYNYAGIDYADEFYGVVVGAEIGLARGSALSWALNLLTIGCGVVLLSFLNKRFAFIREYTRLHTTMLIVLTMSVPGLTTALCPANVVVAMLLPAMHVMFSGYQQQHYRSYIFLISLILSIGSMVDYVFVAYALIFMVGFFQVQIMSFKGFVGMLFGWITPYWIAYGFGLFELADLHLPQLEFTEERYMAVVTSPVIVNVVLTVVTGAAFGAMNALTLISYRRQLRAYNGFFTVLALATTLLLVVDVANVLTYLAVLNVCLAVQAAHFFTTTRLNKSYILFIFLVVANMAGPTLFTILKELL